MEIFIAFRASLPSWSDDCEDKLKFRTWPFGFLLVEKDGSVVGLEVVCELKSGKSVEKPGKNPENKKKNENQSFLVEDNFLKNIGWKSDLINNQIILGHSRTKKKNVPTQKILGF